MTEHLQGLVRMYYPRDGDSCHWHCEACGENIYHTHKPKKPTYDELVDILKNVQNDLVITGSKCSGLLCDGSVAAVNNVLDRVRTGR